MIVAGYQGSSVGPVSYVISASDLSTVTLGNSVHKYANDDLHCNPGKKCSIQTSWAQSCCRVGSEKQFKTELCQVCRDYLPGLQV